MKKQNRRKLKWHRSKDTNGMPYARCDVEIASACDYYVIAEVTHLAGNQYLLYIDSPNNFLDNIKIFGFEQAIERAEKKILAQIAKSIKQLSRYI